MKKFSLLIVLTILVLSSCAKKTEVVEETTHAKDIVETAPAPIVENKITKATNVAGNFDYKDLFNYTGTDKYLGVICDDIVNNVGPMYDPDSKKTVEIPTPIVVKVDDSDKNDIKVYGNFWVYGYSLDGTTFNNENGGSYPGCYHLKEEDGNIVFVSKEIAEEGNRFDESLLRICGGDEALSKEITGISDEEKESSRIQYVSMYAKENGLNITSIKDFGWPIIIFDTATDKEFVYLFYKSYMDEIRQEDLLNDMVERIDNLKNKYMTAELINEKEEESMDVGADMIISAQDATDGMINNLTVNDHGSGSLVVTYEDITINVKIVADRNTRAKFTEMKVG